MAVKRALISFYFGSQRKKKDAIITTGTYLASHWSGGASEMTLPRASNTGGGLFKNKNTNKNHHVLGFVFQFTHESKSQLEE